MMHVPDVAEHEAGKASPPPPAAGELVHLAYTPDAADIAALYDSARTPGWQRVAAIVSYFAFGILLGWALDHSSTLVAIVGWSKILDFVLLFAAAAAWQGMLFGLRWLARRLRARAAAAAARPLTIIAYADFVSVTEDGDTRFFPWGEVLSVWRGRNHVFLALAGGRRLALPRRAFADAAAMGAFAAAAEEHVRIACEREDAAPAATPEPAR